MIHFQREKHQIIGCALHLMEKDLLLDNQCWFGGGTAIVLKLGEYRDSLDIDFICSDPDGFRELRSAAVQRGLAAFFRDPVTQVRDFKTDQYGVRSAFSYRDLVFKFEIIREARIEVSGQYDPDLGVPTLSTVDMFATKLLANADRCQDKSVAFRDAIDLGMLVKFNGSIPVDAIEKATQAYGGDVKRKLRWALEALADPQVLRSAASTLQMHQEVAEDAIRALSLGAIEAFPDIGIELPTSAGCKFV